MRTYGTRSRSRGMTLMELMVVMVVVGILSAIAIPSYRGYSMRATRTDAKRELLSVAQRLERCYTRFNAYNNAACTAALPVFAPSGAVAEDASYEIDGDVDAQEFELVATPVNGQVRDTKCGELTINQAGVQGASGTLSDLSCWQGGDR